MAGHQTVARKLEALERLLLEPEVRRDSDAVGALLADDFVEIAANGQVYDKAQIVAILQNSPSPETALTDFKASRLAPDLALVTFLYSRPATAERPAAKSIRSSLWKRAAGRWRMVFHQGTLVTEK